MDPKKVEDNINKDINAYKKLNKLNRSQEFETFFKLLLDTAANKMIWAFTGDNIESYADFCKVRGEIIAYLYPIQEVRSSDAMVKQLQEQLDNYYKNPIE